MIVKVMGIVEYNVTEKFSTPRNKISHVFEHSFDCVSYEHEQFGK